MNRWTTRRLRRLVVVCACLTPALVCAQETKTVIGPANEDLHNGAEALLAGDAEEGVRLTEKGLQYASSRRDKVAGMSNLCAGYVMLDRPAEGLPWCDEALKLRPDHWRALSNRALANVKLGNLELAEEDLKKAEELAPGARSVKVVRSMLLDITDPVAPLVVIDDRRQDADDEKE